MFADDWLPSDNIVETMTYDSYNELLTDTDGSGRETSYQYSSQGNLLSISCPSAMESNSRLYDQYGNAIDYNPTVQGDHNLLQNGSMEIPGTGGNLLANWTLEASGNFINTSLAGFNSHGNSALEMSTNLPGIGVTDYFYQAVSGVNTGDLLTLRADVKVNTTSGGAFIELNYGNYTDAIEASGTGTLPLILTSQAASSNVTVIIGLYNATGTAWFDGVQLVDAGASSSGYILSGFNSVENSGFEYGMNNWSCTGAAPTVTNTAAWEGAYSLEMQAAGITYQDVPTYGGEPLTFSGMIKTSGLSGTGAYYKIDYYNASGDNSNNLISGASVQTSYATGTQDWTRLSMIATAPSNANHACVQCILNGSGAVYFDDVKLIPRNSELYTYDAKGNYMLTSEDALSNQSQHTYDPNVGNELSFTDPLSHTTNYSYDSLNRLAQVTDPLSHNAYYQYDSDSNLTDTRDPRSASSSDNTYSTYYGPNNLNQLSTLTDPLNQSAAYTYDRSGNLTGVSLPNGQSESFTYDNANRLTRETLSGGQSYSYTYDTADNLTGVTDQNGVSYSWSYDGADRMTSTTDPFSYSLSYQWDKGGNLTSLSGGDYGNLQYAYASDGKLPSMTLPDGSVIYYDYDENGHIFQIEYPGDNNERNMIYASNGWLNQIQDIGFPGNYTYNYYYNNDGTISSCSSWAGWDSFGYDPDGRLTYWYYSPSSLSGGSAIQQNYTYDAAGNITNKGGTAYTYNSANEITNPGFTYDANGNMTSDGNLNYTYNALNQLVQVNQGATLVATYTYNHDGTRRSKTTSQGTTNYDWDASGNLVRESTPGGINYYYYLPSGKIAGFKKSGTTYIIHDNQRGDIESVTTETGTIVAQYHYDPWGNQISYSGTVTLPFGYAGYYYDSETGLYYLKSRYYSPELGRFITRDSYGNIDYGNPQSLDLYSYADDNPVSNIDPSGNIVTAWDTANLSSSEIAGVQAASDAWTAANATGDVAGMAAAHAAADAIRSSHLSSGETIDSSGYVHASSPTTASSGASDKVSVGLTAASLTVDAVVVVATVMDAPAVAAIAGGVGIGISLFSVGYNGWEAATGRTSWANFGVNTTATALGLATGMVGPAMLGKIGTVTASAMIDATWAQVTFGPGR